MTGESFLSWVDTCAIALDDSRTGVLKLLGLSLPGTFTPVRVEAALTSTQVQELAESSGLTVREIKSSWTKTDRKRQTRDTHRAEAQRQDADRATPLANEGAALQAVPDPLEVGELDLSTIEGAEAWRLEPLDGESA